MKKISFAEMIKNSAPKYQESKRSHLSLSEMLEQWTEYPDQDYTLHLAPPASNQSRQVSAKLFSSKKSALNQEEMFDSWIQKQSTISHNKQNFDMQTIRAPSNPQERKGDFQSLKISPFCQQKGQAPKKMADMLRLIDNKKREGERELKISPQIQLINSKHYEEQKPVINKKPVFSNLEEQVTFKSLSEREGKRETGKSNELKLPTYEAQDLVDSQSQQNLINTEELVDSANQIANKYSNLGESIKPAEDDQMLITDSIVKNPIPFEERTFFTNVYEEKAKKEDEMNKKRLESARDTLKDLLKNFNRIKNDTEEPLPSFNPPETYNEPISNNVVPRIDIHSPNSDVGYSFATNTLEETNYQLPIQTKEDRAENIPHIPQILSERIMALKPFEEQPREEEDYNFQKKYLNNSIKESEICNYQPEEQRYEQFRPTSNDASLQRSTEQDLIAENENEVAASLKPHYEIIQITPAQQVRPQEYSLKKTYYEETLYQPQKYFAESLAEQLNLGSIKESICEPVIADNNPVNLLFHNQKQEQSIQQQLPSNELIVPQNEYLNMEKEQIPEIVRPDEESTETICASNQPEKPTFAEVQTVKEAETDLSLLKQPTFEFKCIGERSAAPVESKCSFQGSKEVAQRCEVQKQTKFAKQKNTQILKDYLSPSNFNLGQNTTRFSITQPPKATTISEKPVIERFQSKLTFLNTITTSHNMENKLIERSVEVKQSTQKVNESIDQFQFQF